MSGPPTEKPIHLYHDMTLSPGSSLLVTCNAPITINHDVIISSKDPVQLHAPKVELTLIPHISLDIAFAQGWAKLPNELRAQIIELCLAASRSMTKSDTALILLPFLRMTKEIAGLAREAYYRTNSFFSMVEWSSDRADVVLHCPPRSFHRFIRRLEVQLPFIEMYTVRFWGRLQEMASGRTGFCNLRFLRLQILISNIHSWNWRGKWMKNLEVLHINCDGDVYFRWEDAAASITLQQRAAFEAEVNKRLIFRAEL